MAHDVNQAEREVAAQLRSSLVDRISQDRLDLWIPPSTSWRWLDNCLILTFPTPFERNLTKRMLQKDLEEALHGLVGPKANLRMEVDESLVAEPTKQIAPSALPKPTEVIQEMRVVNALGESRAVGNTPIAAGDCEGGAVQTPLPAENLWNQFVPGACNELAWATANMIVKQPGQMTPVLLHGPYGVGKSHIAAAIAQKLRIARQMRRVVNLSSEQFTNDFTEAILGKGLPMFRRKYRDVEAFILDDVQFLIGKKATIGELRYTLDILLRAGRQVIFLADRSLPELEALGPELVGRIRGGLVSPLMPLDEGTRCEVLKREMHRAKIEITDEFVLQIASRSAGDGRVLKGIVKRLMATSSLQGQQLSWDQCWNSVVDLVQSTQPIVRLKDIERVVCDVFGLDQRSLQSNSKTRTVSQPRMLAMFLARKHTPAAYKEIGDYFGHRRHSTVISAEKTVEAWLNENAELRFGRSPLRIRDAIRHVESQLHVG